MNTPTPRLVVIGIDPGLDGALAALDNLGGLTVHPMPTLQVRTGGKRTVDATGLVGLIDSLKLPTVFYDARIVFYVEQVGAGPGNGSVSMFTFGQAVGVLHGVLAAARVQVNPVRPETWKGGLMVPAAKQGAVARADALLPAHAHLWRGPRGGALDGLAEAALIALWGVRREGVRL